MNKNRSTKRLIFALVFLLLLTMFLGCKKHGEADRLGSRGSINQTITRSKDWRQIVTDSTFQLGEKSVKGFWYVPNGTEDYYSIDYGSYPSIDGSTVAVPMAVEFARQHLGFSDEDANDFAAFNTTCIIRSETTFPDEQHPVDLIIATEPSDDELNLAAQHGVTLIKKPVCYDAFVFITHRNNPVDSLTIEQVRGIYSGAITNWNEVGGNDTPIVAYQREQNSGSQSGMIDLVMKDTPSLSPERVKIVAGMGELVEAVAEYQNRSASIGYTYKYYIDNLYKNENIKTLMINGISTDEENIRSGSYPFSTCYYGVIRSGDIISVGSRFLDWMLSDEGQACIKQAGYIPYSNR
jgi:phosphate transport system substrate-binding protein